MVNMNQVTKLLDELDISYTHVGKDGDSLLMGLTIEDNFGEKNTTVEDQPLKLDLFLGLPKDLKLLHFYIPTLIEVDKSIVGEVSRFLLSTNRYAMFGGFGMREEGSKFIVIYSNGVCLNRGEEPQLWKEEMKDYIGFMCVMCQMVITYIKKLKG